MSQAQLPSQSSTAAGGSGKSAQTAPGAPIHFPPRVRETESVLHRLLDVVFQYFAVLVAVLVVPPVAAFALGIALDRTQVVTARLWADEAAVLSGSPYTGKDNGESAAQHQSTLLLELLQTDSFVSAVISSSDVTATGPADPRAVAEDLRRNVAVSPEGPHVVIIVYPTAQ